VPATIRGIFLDALAKDEPDVTWAGLREVPG